MQPRPLALSSPYRMGPAWTFILRWSFVCDKRLLKGFPVKGNYHLRGDVSPPWELEPFLGFVIFFCLNWNSMQ
jgi:hypothetical protein